MKNKLLATIIFLILLCGIFATSISFRPETKAGIMYHLDVFTDPSFIPINGTGDYLEGTAVALQALDEYVVDDTKYVFDYWDIDCIPKGSANPYKYLYMNEDHNATAHYNTYYNFTVDVLGCGTPKIWTDEAPFWDAVSSKWVKENTFAWAGVFDLLWGSAVKCYGVYICPNQWQGFINWTGPGIKGCNVYPDTPPYYWIQSDPINMTEPKTATAEWKYIYKLYVKKGSLPPMTDPPSGFEGWYDECTYVNLTAPDPHPTWNSPGVARWVFDYWNLDTVYNTTDNPMTVHMDKNHTATVFYTRQSWVILADNIGNQSGFADTGKWYYDCQYYPFSVLPHIDVGGGMRYEFRYWELDGKIFGHGMPDITLHINSTYSGKTLRARYQGQYYLGVYSSGSEVPGFLYPDSDTSGWYDPDTTINLKAKPIVGINPTTRYAFNQWKNHLGGTNSNNNITFPMDQPWNVTAEYDLEYLATWNHDPATIIVAGFPGQTWIKNGTDVWYSAPATDVTGVFQFHYWEINSVTYPQGSATAHVGICTGPIDGTAYYANKTNFYLTPDVVSKDAHADYCTTFDIDVVAANFDADRLVGGEPMAIYAMDFKINFPANLLRLENVDLDLDGFWAGVPEGYFIAKNEIDNTAGTYWLSATVKGNHTGFEGTRVIATLTFHIIYNPCFAEGKITDAITISPLTLLNSEGIGGHQITPELASGTWYYITPPKPVLDIRDAKDGDHSIIVHKNVPQTTFDVEVWLLYGIKVKDFRVYVNYDHTHIEVVEVIIGDYLKPPYAEYSWWKPALGRVAVGVTQEDPPQGAPLQNCSGILFTIKFKVVKAIFWHVIGDKHIHSYITIDCASYISVLCPAPTNIQPDKVNCAYTYNPLIGDVDFDGEVTVLDLQLVADNYCTDKYDITGDTHTDIYDLVIVALHFGNKAEPPG